MTGDKDKLHPFRIHNHLAYYKNASGDVMVMSPTWQHRGLLPPMDTAKILTHGSVPLREMQNDLYIE